MSRDRILEVIQLIVNSWDNENPKEWAYDAMVVLENILEKSNARN